MLMSTLDFLAPEGWIAAADADSESFQRRGPGVSGCPQGHNLATKLHVLYICCIARYRQLPSLQF